MTPIFVITTPHSKCPSASERLCDMRASNVAHIIHNILISKGYQSEIHEAPVFRNTLDLNRPISQNNPWRKNIQSRISYLQNRHDNVILLDIHSFPHGTNAFQIQNEPKIVLLNRAGKNTAIVDKLKNTISSVYTIPASDLNDIIIQADKLGANAMLWEFNENPNYLKDDEIRKFTDILIESLNTKANKDMPVFGAIISNKYLFVILIMFVLLILYLLSNTPNLDKYEYNPINV